MALYYFDASALVKYYILEPGSTWVRGLVEMPATNSESRTNLIIIAEASVAEGAAAFAVLHRSQRISLRARDGAFRAFMSQIASGAFRVAPVLTEDFHAAARLTQRHPLKAYDAIQLAVALRQSHTLAVRGLTLTFVSGDQRQLAVAQAEGLFTGDPFDHISATDPPGPSP